MALRFQPGVLVLVLVSLGVPSGWGQTTDPAVPPAPQPPQGVSCESLPDSRLSGSIRGTVVDETGALVAGAQVTLTGEDPSLNRQAVASGEGQFCFPNVAPGPFQLTITSAGFAIDSVSGILHAGEIETFPQITLDVAAAQTDVEVTLTPHEVAAEQLKVQEQQRVLGVIPNFYVSYVPNAAPLSPRQKFQLAWKTVTDPVTFGLVGAIAGVQQAQNHFAGYGQGLEGYAKRYGAGYADTLSGTFIGGAILPSLLKQDPRYFYKGTGGARARIRYAIANAVICKGDNGRWQVNYSNIVGSLAAGGISNLYYPPQDRDGAELTFENAAVGLGASAITNLMQEFVIRKFTPKAPPASRDPAKP